MKKAFAVIGSWGFGNGPKGLTVYKYDSATGQLTDPVRYDETVSAGHQCYDPKQKILYVADEVDNHPGEAGGGGYVRAYRVEEETGQLSFINEVCVLMTKPAYLALDSSGGYLLAACHTGRGYVTKVVHDAQGNWTSAVYYDDAGVVLVRINEDGSLGPVCDVAVHAGLTRNKKQVHAHPHSVVGSPDGQVYFACDKGLDRIYSYRINREEGKLIPLTVSEMPFGTAPRYSAFHPNLPVWYENNEGDDRVYAFGYDAATGALKILSTVNLSKGDESANASPSDITVHPNGRFLYAASRGLSSITVCAIDECGGITYLESVDSVFPVRGFCISPDGRYLLAACEGKNLVKIFSIREDGRLSDTDREYPADGAANVQIIEV